MSLPRRVLPLFLLILPTSLAHAGPIDPSVTAPASGVTVAPSLTPTGSPPLWVTQDDLVITWAAPANTSPTQLGCWDVTDANPVLVGGKFLNGKDPAGSFTAEKLAATSAGDKFYVLDVRKHEVTDLPILRSWQVQCGKPAIAFSDIPAPANLGLPPFVMPIAADGTVLMATNLGLLRFDPKAKTLTTLLEPQAYTSTFPAPAGMALNVVNWQWTGLTLGPDGTPWLLMNRSSGSDVEQSTAYLAILKADGKVQVQHVWPEVSTQMAGGLVWDQAWQALVAGPVTVKTGVAVQEQALLFVRPSGPSPTPAAVFPSARDLIDAYPGYDFIGLVGGSDRRARAVHKGSDFRVGVLGLDAAHADFDRDGLNLEQEVALGLSDQSADGDGDGVGDGTEVVHTKTDPKDGANPKPAPPSDYLLAPSSFPSDFWAGAMWRDPHAGKAICIDIGKVCFGPDGKPLPQSKYLNAPVFSLDGAAAFMANGNSLLQLLMTPNAKPTQVTPPEPALTWFPNYIHAISATEFYHGGVPHQLTRFDHGVPHVVLDPKRADCPITATAEDLKRCGDADLRLPLPIKDWWVLGVDPERQALLIFVHAGPYRRVLQVTKDTVQFVFDTTRLPQGLSPTSMLLLPEGDGWLVQLAASGPKQGYRGSVRLDRAFRVLPVQQPIVHDPMAPTARFRHGFLSTGGESFKHELSPAGGCIIDGWSYCTDAKPTGDPEWGHHGMRFEWVKTPLGLRPGEVLAFARSTYSSATHVSFVEPSGAIKDVPGHRAPDWQLWRIGVLGGMVRWLDAAAFTKLADANGMASLAAKPLTPLVHLAVRDDGQRVCLVEPGRVWELALDAEGVPTGLGLSSTADVRACGYAADGQLALLEPGKLGVGAASFALSGDVGLQPQLVRVGNRWIIGGPKAVAVCLDAAGKLQSTGLEMVTLAALNHDSLTWLDEHGSGQAARVDFVCSGKGMQEHFASSAEGTYASVWYSAISQIWYRWPDVTGGAMTVRPDGMVLVSTLGLGDGASPFTYDLLYRVRPAWQPKDWQDRLSELDPLRRAQTRVMHQSFEMTSVTAMATVPGGPSVPDGWEHFGHTPPPPIGPPQVTKPEEKPVAAKQDAVKDDGCSTGRVGNSMAVWLVFLALASCGIGRKRRIRG